MLNWLIIFILPLTIYCFLHFDTASTSNANIHYEFKNLQELEEGDIIFRKGISVESYAVLMAQKPNQRRYSHVGIIHFNNKDQPMVVHAAPASTKIENKIQMESIAHFWSEENAVSGQICRKPLTNNQKDKIKKYLNQIYNNGVEFDDAYKLHDTTKLYCTELIYCAFAKADIAITNGYIDTLKFLNARPIIFPNTILRHNKLKTVYLFRERKTGIRKRFDFLIKKLTNKNYEL